MNKKSGNPMLNSKLIKMFFIITSVSLLMACQSMNSKVGTYFSLDTDLQIDFVVDSDINPDESGSASPLFIRMYELSNDKMIGKADFIELFESDKDVLGADLVAKHELKRFKPGESRTENFVIAKSANHVALFAEFLDFKEAKFKLIFPVVANNVFRNKVSVHVSGNELILKE